MRGKTMKIIGLFLALTMLTAAAAFAAGLTDADLTYLHDHWGLKRDGTVVKNLTAAEQVELDSLINDPIFRGRWHSIENQVGDYLFKIETCTDWSGAGPCPNAPGPNDPPGRRIADRNCISCHLVGTAVAPSYFRLSKSGGWTAARLGDALASGHYMSPITLSEAELHDLANYIASFK
jgi:hypothetical protein